MTCRQSSVLSQGVSQTHFAKFKEKLVDEYYFKFCVKGLKTNFKMNLAQKVLEVNYENLVSWNIYFKAKIVWMNFLDFILFQVF